MKGFQRRISLPKRQAVQIHALLEGQRAGETASPVLPGRPIGEILLKLSLKLISGKKILH